MIPAERATPWLVLAIAVLLAGGLGAVGRGSEVTLAATPGSPTSVPSVSEQATDGAGAGSGAQSADAPVQAAPPTTAATAAAAAPAATAAPSGPPPVKPAQAGRYRYLVHDHGTGPDEDSETLEITDVAAATGPASGASQVWTDPDSGVRRQMFWTPQALTIRSEVEQVDETEDGKPVEATCDWQPDLTMLRLPLRVGQSWTTDSKCTITDPEGTETRHYTEKSTVERADVDTIDGQRLDVWVIRSTVRTEQDLSSPEGSLRSITDETQTVRFAPALGMPTRWSSSVRESGSATEAGGKPETMPVSTYQSDHELLRLPR